MSDGLDSTVYSTTVSDGGSESGDQAETISEKNGGLETEQQLMNEEDVQQSSVKAEDTPAGEPGDAAAPLRTAGHAAGESENRDETSNAENSQVALADTKPSVVEGSQTCASDAADVDSINLAGKQSQTSSKRAKERAKKQRQRAAKRAQEEQEKDLRSGDETHVECRAQHEDPKPLGRVASPKFTTHTLSKDQRFQSLCSNAIGVLQELDDTDPASSKYAVPVQLSEPDSSDEAEVHATAASNSLTAGMPLLPCKRLNTNGGVGASGDQAHSSLDLRGAQSSKLTTTSNNDEVSSADRPHPATSKSQDNCRVVDGVEEPSECFSPCQKLLKGTGKRRAHGTNGPVEAANSPGKTLTPSFYDDFEIDADKQSHFQCDGRVPPDANGNAANGNGEKMDAISKAIAGLAGMRALLDIQLRLENFGGSPENNTSQQVSEDGAEDGKGVAEEQEGDLEEVDNVEEVDNGGEGLNAAADSSMGKAPKKKDKKSKKGKKKDKKKW
ncbi:hypothetical protein BC567DRAFT_296621 [Phyllosticta citribraziliensis]